MEITTKNEHKITSERVYVGQLVFPRFTFLSTCKASDKFNISFSLANTNLRIDVFRMHYF